MSNLIYPHRFGFGAGAGVANAMQGALVSKSANQAITTGTTTTALSWATERFDTGSFWSAGSPNQFVAPGAGYMQVFWGVRWETVTSETIRFARPLLNGATFHGGGQEAYLAPASASRSSMCGMSAMVPVVGGDVFTLEVAHNRGSNLNVLADDGTYFGCRYVPSMDGCLLGLTATESISSATLTYVPWDFAIFDTIGAWSAGDPTKLTIPASNQRRVRFYGGARFGNTANAVFVDIDRDSGSRPGGSLALANTTGTGGFTSGLSVASALFKPQYNGTEYGGAYSGLDSVPNDYLLQVYQNNGSAILLSNNGSTYLGCELVPGLQETLIRLAANQSISNATFTKVDWGNNVAHDDYGIYNPAAPTKLTTPAGYNYALLVANVAWGAAAAGERFAQFLKNGASFPGQAQMMLRSTAITNNPRSHIATLVPISSAGGDYFEVEVWQNSTISLNLLAGDSPTFGMMLIP